MQGKPTIKVYKIYSMLLPRLLSKIFTRNDVHGAISVNKLKLYDYLFLMIPETIHDRIN